MLWPASHSNGQPPGPFLDLISEWIGSEVLKEQEIRADSGREKTGGYASNSSGNRVFKKTLKKKKLGK